MNNHVNFEYWTNIDFIKHWGSINNIQLIIKPLFSKAFFILNFTFLFRKDTGITYIIRINLSGLINESFLTKILYNLKFYISRTVLHINPFKATFIQSTMTQRCLKTIYALLSWYSVDIPRWVHLDEYQFSRVSVFFQLFLYWWNWPPAP